MNTIEYEKTLFIKAPSKYLGDVMSDLPDNVYLNKTTCGSGATHLCLTNNINYVVIVPYRSAIHNKVKSNSSIFAVEAGVSEDDITTHVLFSNTHSNTTCKIMTTYDSFYKVYSALKTLNKLQDFKLCIDESHVLVSLAKIKGGCFNFLYKHFREFKSFVFVTATPNNKTLLPSAIRDVEFVRVIWEVSERVHITEQRVKTLSECNKHVVEICKQHLFGEVEGNAYIFYNSVSEIISVIQKLKKMEDFNPQTVNIFCAENPYNDKKISLQLGKLYTKGSFSDNKKINFLTSANYESCDILDPDGKTYIIVSSKRNSTALTNHIAVVQACGRLRESKYKLEAKMLVCGFEEDVYQQPRSEFLVSLENMEKTAQYLIDRSKKTKSDGFMDAYMKDIESFSTNPFVIVSEDLELEINEGARLSEMQTYEAFNSHVCAIPSGDVANTIRTVDNEMLKVSDESRFLVEDKVDFSRMMKKYIQSLEEGDVGLTEMIESRSEIHKQFVEVLGIAKIKSVGFHKTKLTNAYALAVKFNKNNLEIKSMLKGLRVGGRYTSSHITELLQTAYNSVGIDRKAVSNDIKNYFTVEKTQVVNIEDGKRKQGYRLLNDLYTEDY